MGNLTRRIVARYLAAGFIPDKFWREHKAKIKDLLTKKVPNFTDVPFVLLDLESVYKNIGTRLSEMGGKAVQPAIDLYIDNALHFIKATATSYSELDRELSRAQPWPLQTAEDEVKVFIVSFIRTHVNQRTPTAAHAMKVHWKVDHRKILDLASRVMKKATPEEVKALQAAAQGSYSNFSMNTKFAFFDRVRLEANAVKLLQKEKITYDLLKSFDRIPGAIVRELEDSPPEYENFDLHGMKVIVDDSTVTPQQIREYIKYLDAAYQLMRRKGVGKAWYGTVFIQCASCGGVNYNTGGGVGGNYWIHRDVVNIFERPSPFIVELMAHELGHRYWFKMMSPTQRAKFESIVKVRKTAPPDRSGPNYEQRMKEWQEKTDEEWAKDPRPVVPVSDYGKSNIDEAFAEAFAHYVLGKDMNRDQIESFRSVLKTASDGIGVGDTQW